MKHKKSPVEDESNLKYEGVIRLHYCQREGCYPPTWFSESQKPEPCPDCSTISRVATPEEESKRRDNLSHSMGGLDFYFLIKYDPAKPNGPQNGYRVAMEQLLGNVS